MGGLKINTPGAGGPTPGGTAGGNSSTYFFFVLAFAFGLAEAAFFFGAALFFVAANVFTSFQINRNMFVLPVIRPWGSFSPDSVQTCWVRLSENVDRV